MHSLGIKAGWYGNNCRCRETSNEGWGPSAAKHYAGDVNATVLYGFDGIKFDNCGLFKNTAEYAQLFNHTGKAVMIEQCHWGQGPGFKGSSCNDYNFFRSSKDIEPNYQSVLTNVHSVVQWQPWSAPPGSSRLATGPGCWAYPDMLMVGNLNDFTTERTHFGLWCIVSSPLVLSFDVANETTVNRVWPVENPLSNQESARGH